MGARNKLSAAKVQKESTPGRHSDGGGLYLRVKDTGSKTWSYMWKRDGLQREISLGPFPDVPLKLAREKAQTAREAIQSNDDPREALNPPSQTTFLYAAHSCMTDRRLDKKSPKTKRKWERTVNELCTALHKRPVSSVTREDVLALLKPIWNRTPETGRIVRSQREVIFRYAKGHGWCDGENPAIWKGGIGDVLTLPDRDDVRHHPSLPYVDLPTLMDNLQGLESMSALALQFVILTGTRSNETRSADWSEFDLENRSWVIPKERMKNRKEHRVPLSQPAMDILRRVEGLSVDWVFPSPRGGKPLTDVALAKCVAKFHDNDAATVHGMRATFRVWAEEQTSFPEAAKEHAISHNVANDVAAAYNRTDLFEMRRDLMEAWGRFATNNPRENVIPLKKGG